MDSNKGSGERSVFITDPKIHIDDYPTEEIVSLQALVSGVSEMSQSTLLLKKRKEMREIDDALLFMKEEYDQRMDTCEERYREFERKQQEMREQVSRFEKFIRENDAKRQRADIKAKTEHRLCEQNDIRKNQLELELEKDLRLQTSLKTKLARLCKYSSYLEHAVEASEDEYEEIGDILNRYSTLGDANKDLKSQVKSAETEMDVLRGKLRAVKREIQNQILVQNSEIQGYQQQLETLRAEALQLDLTREREDKNTNDRTRESGQIILAVKNLYHRCLQSMQSKVPPLKEHGMDVQDYMQEVLKVIAERTIDLDHIVSNYQENMEYKGYEQLTAAAPRISGNTKAMKRMNLYK